MAGAHFVRADLHVHTFSDSGDAREPDVAAYVATAEARGVAVLGITDHNTTRRARDAVAAARESSVLVLPGIEITTHEGHLLALFAPEAMATLEEFAGANNLGLTPDPADGSLRTNRSMLDLVDEIWRRDGLAIPAHVDRSDGLDGRMPPTALAQLLAHKGLAGLEFTSEEHRHAWFAATDSSVARRGAWEARQRNHELAARGLAKIMSSDAHLPEQVGNEPGSRTLTRLRLDDLNFTAVRNALVFNPRARCKCEADLPVSYPRILGASFEGGFLDGVDLDLSENLTCVIGGRGSGKSTALLAIRAAVGAEMDADEDPDDADRMPDRTTVRFVDAVGSERVAVRERGQSPVEQGTDNPIELVLADLGQEESGRLAKAHETDPASLLRFLDQFVDLRSCIDRESDLIAELADNAAEIQRASQGLGQLIAVEQDVRALEATLGAAEKGRIEAVADWSRRLASEVPLLDRISAVIDKMTAIGDAAAPTNLDRLAGEVGADLGVEPAKKFVDGPHVYALNWLTWPANATPCVPP